MPVADGAPLYCEAPVGDVGFGDAAPNAMEVALLALMIPIVAILAGTYQTVAKMKAKAGQDLGQATGHLEDALADAEADRDRMRRRLEALEAIVTSEGYDLDREARRAGLADGRIDGALLDPVDDRAGASAASSRGARRRRS